MRNKFLYTVSAVVLLVSTPALASECEKDLMAYNDEVSASDEYRPAMGARLRSDIRQLRDSARILSQAGQEEACVEVVNAIKEMVENPQEATGTATTYEEWQTGELERLKNAQSLDEVPGQLRAEEIIGSDIRNFENEDLGEIEDLLIETKEGKTSYAIVSHGGFLGLGDKQIAIPLQNLKVTEDKDVFVINASEEQIEEAPSFERGAFETTADESWRKKNEAYFESMK